MSPSDGGELDILTAVAGVLEGVCVHDVDGLPVGSRPLDAVREVAAGVFREGGGAQRGRAVLGQRVGVQEHAGGRLGAVLAVQHALVLQPVVAEKVEPLPMLLGRALPREVQQPPVAPGHLLQQARLPRRLQEALEHLVLPPHPFLHLLAVRVLQPPVRVPHRLRRVAQHRLLVSPRLRILPS